MLTWIPISSQIVEIATPSTKCRRIARTFSSPSKCRRVFPFSLIDNPPHPYPLTMQRISVIVHFQERQHSVMDHIHHLLASMICYATYCFHRVHRYLDHLTILLKLIMTKYPNKSLNRTASTWRKWGGIGVVD